jgi:ABC-2 type transport system permease protein
MKNMLYDACTVWIREMIRFWRSRSRIIGSLAMPFFYLAMMGAGFSGIVTNVNGSSYIEFLFPGIIGMTLLFSSTFSGVSVLVDKQFGFMKEILVAPVSRLSIMMGKTIGGATTALINGLIVMLLAFFIGLKVISVGNILLAFIFMFLISVSFVSLGIAIASKLNDTSGFQLVMNFLVMPMFFLSGALFPIDKSPEWMQAIAHVDPLFYGVDGLRATMIGSSIYPLFFDLGILLLFCVATIGIGTYFFRKLEV